MKINVSILLLFVISLFISELFAKAEEQDDKVKPLLLHCVVGNELDNPHEEGRGFPQERNYVEEVKTWLTEEVIPVVPQSTIKNFIMNGTELYMSLARGAVYGVLGYNLLHSADEESASREIVSILYGGCAAIPMALLGSISSRQFIEDTSTFFEKYFTKKRQFEQVIEQPLVDRMIKLGAKLLFIGTPALISSSTLTNLAREEFIPIVGSTWWIVGAPTLFIRVLMDYEKIPQVYERIRNQKQIQPIADEFKSYMGLSNERKLLEDRVKRHLLGSKAYISFLADEDVLSLLNRIEANSSESKLRDLFGGRRSLIKETTAEKITGLTVASLSLAGLWVLYPLTVDFFVYFLDSFNVKGDQSFSSNLLASIALSSASAINAISGYEIGKKSWFLIKPIGKNFRNLLRTNNPDALLARERIEQEKTNYQEYAIGTLSVFLAACTASTSYGIYKEWPIENQIVAITVLTAAISSLFTISAWAVDGALNKYLNSKNPREPLLTKFDKIIRKLPDISDQHLQALEKILQSASEKFTNALQPNNA